MRLTRVFTSLKRRFFLFRVFYVRVFKYFIYFYLIFIIDLILVVNRPIDNIYVSGSNDEIVFTETLKKELKVFIFLFRLY
jgi:hypothetical protein